MWIQSEDQSVLINSDEVQAFYLSGREEKTIVAKLHSGDTCTLKTCVDKEDARKNLAGIMKLISKDANSLSLSLS